MKDWSRRNIEEELRGLSDEEKVEKMGLINIIMKNNIKLLEMQKAIEEIKKIERQRDKEKRRGKSKRAGGDRQIDGGNVGGKMRRREKKGKSRREQMKNGGAQKI